MGLATAIGGALSLGGAILGSKSANKNAKRAAQVSADNNAQNVALQRDIYNQNMQLLSPYNARGNAAGDAINALLGLGPAPAQQQQAQVMPNALSQFYGGNVPAAARYGIGEQAFPYSMTGSPTAMLSQMSGPSVNMPTTMSATSNPLAAQNAAFDNFRNSTGYQFRLGEGMNALNSGYAGAGVLQSGDAMRAAQEYGQNFASNEFGNYMGMLANQQGVGLSGASAVAGVGQNYANNITQMNTQDAANQANALLSRQNPLANVAGMVGGGLFNYGMGKL